MCVTDNYSVYVLGVLLLGICLCGISSVASSPCVDPGLGGDLTIAEGVSCSIAPPGFAGALGSLDVRGSLLIESTSSSHVTLRASSVTVASTGRISADQSGYGAGSGPGGGNSVGSGGRL